MSTEDKSLQVAEVTICQQQDQQQQSKSDYLPIELPVEIQVKTPTMSSPAPLVTTLCTPTDPQLMALGFLFSEGLITTATEVTIETPKLQQVIVNFTTEVNWQGSARQWIQHAGCGLCSQTVLNKLLFQPVRPLSSKQKQHLISTTFIHHLLNQVENKQPIFQQTGATHAAALLDQQGNFICLYEDIGRHNAVDKVIGYALTQNLELNTLILWVSGRAGFELVQKAVMAGVIMMLSVGAPSSLSLELAESSNLCLVGFAKENRYNIYC